MIFNITINLLLMIVVVFFAIFAFLKRKSNNKYSFDFLSSRKYFLISFWTIVAVGIFLRIFMFNIVPGGINPDEGSSVYEAYSILNYGIDRNGKSFPVYLISWGGGQNALLTYLCIPFVAIFGTNVVSARIVMLIFSIVCMFVIFLLSKELGGKKFGLITLFLFAICPYDIMISRWGLESNLFPCMLLLAFYFLVRAIKHNHWWLTLACAFFGLSLYSYAISYMFVPTFLIAVYIYMFAKKKIRWSSFLVGNTILGCLAFPLIAFMFVNFGIINEFKIFGLFTVPKMTIFRGSELGLSFSNVGEFFKVLFLGIDGHPWNGVGVGSIFFLAGIPVILVGLIRLISNIKAELKSDFSFWIVILIWLTISVVLGCLVQTPNINKVNHIWMPLYFVLALGFVELSKVKRSCFVSLCLVFLVLTCSFGVVYYDKNNDFNKALANSYSVGLYESVEFVSNKGLDKTHQVYISDGWSPHIAVLLGAKVPPQEFLNTVKWKSTKGYIRNAKEFCNFHIGFDYEIDSENSIFIVKNNDSSFKENVEGKQSKNFGEYIVYFS